MAWVNRYNVANFIRWYFLRVVIHQRKICLASSACPRRVEWTRFNRTPIPKYFHPHDPWSNPGRYHRVYPLYDPIDIYPYTH